MKSTAKRKSHVLFILLFFTFNQFILSGQSASADALFDCPGGTYAVVGGVLQGGSTCNGDVVLDSSVTTIGYATYFEGADGQSITSIYIPSSVISIYDYFPLGFRTSDLVQYIVDPDNPNYSSVDGVLYDKFQTRLIAYPRGKPGSSFTIPNSVSEISNYAFQCSKYLQTIDIGDYVYTIGQNLIDYTGACWSGSLIREINVSAGNPYYSSIDGVLFDKSASQLIKYPYAKSGTTYTVPSTVTQIGVSSFKNNSTLTNITLPSGLAAIETYAFSESALTSIYIPANVYSYGSYMFWGSRSLEAITVAEGNSVLKSIEGVLYSIDGQTLLEYPGGRQNESFSIPNGVTTLANQWTSNRFLKRLTIPTTVTSIGSGVLDYWWQGNYLIFEGDSFLSSISGNYARNIIYCGNPNSEILSHANSFLGIYGADYAATVRCPTENQVPNFEISTNSLSGILDVELVPYSITTIVAPDGFYISPAIFDGLVFDITTGILSGTPTSTSLSGIYTITGHNWLGSVSKQININIRATSEEAALANAAAEIARREAEKRTARADLEILLKNSGKIDLALIKKADISGINENNIANFLLEVQSLPKEEGGELGQLLKIARKYEIIGTLASEKANQVFSKDLVEIGLIPVDSNFKSSLTARIKKLPSSERSSYSSIESAIARELALIQIRNDRLRNLKTRLSSLKFR